MSEPKLKCYECGKRKPDLDTCLVFAWVGGDYRRSKRRGHVRVCRDCVQDKIKFASEQQGKNLNWPLNSGRISWEEGARKLGVEIPFGMVLDYGRVEKARG